MSCQLAPSCAGAPHGDGLDPVELALQAVDRAKRLDGVVSARAGGEGVNRGDVHVVNRS